MKTAQPLIGGVLATAGDVVFTGEGNGDFSAFNARTGERLWTFNCGAGVNAPPISYELDGVQYIAVAAGGSAHVRLPAGRVRHGVRAAALRSVEHDLRRSIAVPNAQSERAAFCPT